MKSPTALALPWEQPLIASWAGLFISRGEGIHPSRTVDFHELILVRKGVLHMEEEGRPLVIGEGQILLLFPGLHHRGTQPYPKDLSFYWLHFYLKPFRAGRVSSTLKIDRHASIRRPERLAELFHWYQEEQEAGTLKPESASLLARMMLSEAADRRPISTGHTSSADILAHRAREFIMTHFQTGISTDGIARKLQCNPDYLGRVFRRVEKMSPVEFIHLCRLREARLLLRESSLNIEQVARKCGFVDGCYFRRIFQRHEGMAPLAYRRLHSRANIVAR